MARLTPDQRSTVPARYLAGESSMSIAADLGCSPAAICALLDRRGVQRRSHRTNSTRLPLNHGALDDLTPEASYWCGFLFADGTVIRRPDGADEVALVLAERDREHVDRFRSFLGSGHAITPVSDRLYGTDALCYRFAVRSDPLAYRLRSLGRYGGPVANKLAESRDFWRGVVDGDGSIGAYADHRSPSRRTAAQLRVVGEQWLLESFRTFLATTGVATTASVRPHKSIYVFAVGGAPAVRAADLLYRDAAVALSRKHNAALNIAQRGVEGLGSSQRPARGTTSQPARG